MNSKTTGIWFTIAAALFALIYFFDRFLHPSAAESSCILPELRPPAVTSVQVIPSGALEICAARTNNVWLLTKPIAYPAQPTAIEALLDALQKLTPATRISAAELRNHHNAELEFGFETPRISLVIETGGQRRQLLVGNKTPPGDQVYLRVVGTDGAFVADADWLKFIPRTANDWRDTSLVNVNNAGLDWIVLTNGTKVMELRRDATNHFWRMIRPFPARADADRITDALQHFQVARDTQFISDDPKTDLAAFGLQPADLDLWLGHGTNFISAIHVGKSPTNDPTQVFVRREGWNTIATTAREPLSPWRGSVNDFRDSHLLELTVPVAEIEVSPFWAGAGQFHVATARFERLANCRRKIPRGRGKCAVIHQKPRRIARRGIRERRRDRARFARLRAGKADAANHPAFGGGRHEQCHCPTVLRHEPKQ